MAYGIDAVMDAVEPARHRAVRGGSRSEPERAELPAGDHPVLGRRERPDELIQGGCVEFRTSGVRFSTHPRGSCGHRPRMAGNL